MNPRASAPFHLSELSLEDDVVSTGDWYIGRPEETIDYFKARAIRYSCPTLAEYLRLGLSALDVGCGSGGITTNVASVIFPGRVIGWCCPDLVDMSTLRKEK
jgi:hypothetical protein